MNVRTLPVFLPLLLFPALAAAGVPARFQGKLEPCLVPGMDEEVLCGTRSVWEDREARSGRQIDLHVVVVPALSPDPVPDPLVYLAGGPGEAATDAAPFAALLPGIRRDRDLVFVDNRGTGKSGILECRFPGSDEDPQGYLREMFPLEPIRACAEELGRRADLRLYTNVQAMDDLDDVRAWLGYERLNLYGGSYGTRSALVYQKRHPEHVRSLVLDAVVPLGFRSPTTYARSAQTALDRLFDDCAAEPACRGAFPDLRAKLAAVLEALDKAPGRGTVVHPETGRRMDLAIPRTAFAATLRSMQYSPTSYIRIPLVIHEASRGNYAPILWAAMERAGPAYWMGSFLSVTCAEDVARLDPAEAERQSRGTFLGEDRVRQQRAACSVWPTARLEESFWIQETSPVPVLVVSGWLDPVTPPEGAAEVLEAFPNHAHVVIRDAAHGTDGLNDQLCHLEIVSRFLESGSPIDLDTSCTRRMTRRPFVLKHEPEAGEGS